jgi:O-succinylbenzoic acid--CoA ligase
VRSVLAGTTPVVVDATRGFRTDAFARAADGLGAGRRYTSVVPTQLHRLLDGAVGVAALRQFDAVLVGGAATPRPLLDRARAAGVPVVRTFGASETSGGCVYDGVPLDGVRVRTDDGGHVLVAGPVLASGYLGRPDLDALALPVLDGERWWRSGDLGEVRDGRLTVLGRADDVIVTGGVKVAPAAVERPLVELPGVREASVVGLPDAAWGQAVTAVVVPPRGSAAPTLDEVRRHVTERLGAAAAPRDLLVVPTMPLRGPGKIDRRAVAELAAARRTTP